ncbi:hypothetical protein AAFF_G00171990 [Aldrovandia affinis]|uniref:Uncharacterized protein n=1 Tax=Aldrovandia affinis TaxID=143900 RepID=A0AAD7WW59_9TELE|nr:hypothetical protein AAFF_G00171990 [Aldrovandia affinis]
MMVLLSTPKTGCALCPDGVFPTTYLATAYSRGSSPLTTVTDFLRACLKMRSIILIALFLMIGQGVSSAQNVVLNGVVGQSVVFPDAVKKSGTLILHKGDSPQPIGDVTGGQFTDFTEGRVQWNSTTGRFSISGLKEEDSGTYTLLNNDF